MCGIVGFFSDRISDRIGTISRMVKAIQHRGPDEQQHWIDPQSGLTLGHARLAILDLSTTGAQPMWSHSKRFIIVFNGEIYNFKDIKKILQDSGINFRGGSDTEVMLAAFEKWGVIESLPKFDGMFAFAVWDLQENVLTLARDKFGEKPLYLYEDLDKIIFGSELKAILAFGGLNTELNIDSISLFSQFGYVPGDNTIFLKCKKIPPAGYVALKFQDKITKIKEGRYWDLQKFASDAIMDPLVGDDISIINKFDELLTKSVISRMVADVPVGTFLSGGIDSSLITAIMQKTSSKQVKSFSIGFDIKEFDESDDAQRVATHLKTDHKKLLVTSKDALNVIPKLPTIYDEPFADSSQIPTYLLAAMTRKDVTVSLSGDGGDELFGGYNRYRWCNTSWDILRMIPLPLRNFCGYLLTHTPSLAWQIIGRILYGSSPSNYKIRLQHRGLRLAEILKSTSRMQVYSTALSHWSDPHSGIINAAKIEPCWELNKNKNWEISDNYIRQMMYLDLLTYFPDDILVKIDRAAMAASLETRIPLLDPDILRFSMRLPDRFIRRDGVYKWILRETLKRYVPEAMFNRPKMGFGVPMESWLAGPLKEWADDLLSSKSINSIGVYNSGAIKKMWDDFLSGKRLHYQAIWNICSFQSWHRQWI